MAPQPHPAGSDYGASVIQDKSETDKQIYSCGYKNMKVTVPKVINIKFKIKNNFYNMPKHTKIFFGAMAVATIFLLSSLSSAREDYYRPTIGDLLPSISGAERVFVDSGGLLTAIAGDSTILPGFPVSSANAVFSSSPVLADVNGDGAKEIAVVSRDSADNYRLEIYSGSGVSLASAAIVGTVYFDPAVLSFSGQTRENIIIATNEGKVYEWSLIGGALSSKSIMGGAMPVSAAVGSNGNVYLTYPKSAKFEIYVKNSGVWTKSKSYPLPKPIIFPLVDSGDGKLYGIYDNNSLVAINSVNGTVTAGFPVSIVAPVLSEPVIADFDSANPGKEIVVDLSNGDRNIFKTNGTILQQQKNARGYLDDSIGASDEHGVFYGINQLGGKIVSAVKEIVSAVYAKIKLLVNTVINLILPAPVTGLQAAADAQGIKLAWNDYSDQSDLDHFNIYRSISNSIGVDELSVLDKVASSSAVSYIDWDFDANTPNYYTITAVNKDGKESPAGVWVGPISLNNVPNKIAGWHFNEVSGQTIYSDSSGNVNNMTCADLSCPIGGNSGLFGNDVLLNGKNNYLAAINTSSLNPTDAVSIEAWIKPKNFSNDPDFYEVITTKNLNYELTISKTGAIRYGITNEANVRQAQDSPNVLNFDVWNHVVITYDGTIVLAYLNGELVDSVAQTGKIKNDDSALTIGQWNNAYHYNGEIDELNIYNRALNAADIKAHYARIKNISLDTFVYYKMDETVGSNNFIDSSGNSNDAVCAGNSCSVAGVSGRKDTALLFDGKDDYLKLDDNTTINPTKQVTMEAWIKPAFKPGDTFYQVVATKNLNYELTVSKEGALRCGITNTSGYRAVKDIPNIVLNNRWNHVAMTYDGAQIVFYVNGEPVGTLPQTGFIRVDNLPLLIGQWDNYYWFDGVIDELKIYDKALAATDIKSHYDEFPVSADAVLPLNLNLDESVGAMSFADQSGNNNTAVCSGASCPLAGVEGKINTGLQFDGKNDNLTVSSTDISNLKKFVSIEAWIKPSFTANDPYYEVILTKDLNYELSVSRDGALRTGIINQSGYRSVFDSVGVVKNNQWNHLAVTYDGAKVRAYANGVKVGEQAQTGFILANDNPITIGIWNNYYWFNGYMDNVKVYGSVLSDADILNHYNNPQ